MHVLTPFTVSRPTRPSPRLRSRASTSFESSSRSSSSENLPLASIIPAQRPGSAMSRASDHMVLAQQSRLSISDSWWERIRPFFRSLQNHRIHPSLPPRQNPLQLDVARHHSDSESGSICDGARLSQIFLPPSRVRTGIMMAKTTNHMSTRDSQAQSASADARKLTTHLHTSPAVFPPITKRTARGSQTWNSWTRRFLTVGRGGDGRSRRTRLGR
jgi:hypothetical protein